MLKTRFWKSAAASLPPAVRERYIADLEAAERWELGLDRTIEAFSRAKAALGFGKPRTHEPRGAH